MRRGVAITMLAGVLACGGFMEDVESTGSSAISRIGSVSAPLPSSARQARVVETTGIDWMLNGEALLDRAEADAWFNGLTLACDQPTTSYSGAPTLLHQLKPGSWGSPARASEWKTKACEDSNFSGPHYAVGVTHTGDPAWVFVQVITL